MFYYAFLQQTLYTVHIHLMDNKVLNCVHSVLTAPQGDVCYCIWAAEKNRTSRCDAVEVIEAPGKATNQ